MKQKTKNEHQPRDKASIDIGLFKKKIKKEEKELKYKNKLENQEPVEPEEEEEAAPVPQKKVNIFAIDNYDSGVKTVIHTQSKDN